METYNEKVLVIDPETEVCQLLNKRLTLLGYKVVLAPNGQEALLRFNAEAPDLIILELLLPDVDGYSVYREIRKNSQVPVVVLTALTNTSHRIMGLELGVNDYITKPFSQKLLEASIRSLLSCTPTAQKSTAKKSQKKLLIGNLIIDTHAQIISKNNSRIKLTEIEFNLLKLLVENSGNKLSREMILSHIWGYTPERYADTRIVDVHISRLRSKIEENRSNPELILTVRGIGYMFQRY